MEMVATYANQYGGPPDPEMPWPLFASLTDSATSMKARELLTMTDAVSLAIASSFGEKNPEALVARAKLEAAAYGAEEGDNVRYVLKQSGKDDA